MDAQGDRTCARCRWWGGTAKAAAEGKAAKCRRLPPHVMRDMAGDPVTVWPWSFADEWCGGFQARATARPALDAEKRRLMPWFGW
jgi:hypothetical protein